MNNLSSYSSSFPYCYLSEAVAPYQCSASTSSNTASKTISSDATRARSSPLMEADNNSHSEVNASSSDKRRKGTDMSSCLTSSHLKNSNGGKIRKQSRVEEKNKKGEEIMKAKLEAPQNGYIHVRARRGQATDNHSLAERVRREKISKRMKILQSLVPGCDKVTGKAHMLDEIINYVQSLQNQVEFLSLRLASANPMLFENAVHLDEIQRVGALAEQVSHADQSNQSNNFGPRATALDYQMFFNSSLSSLLQSQLVGPTTSFSQDGGSDAVMVQVGEQEQEAGFSSQLGFDNIFCD